MPAFVAPLLPLAGCAAMMLVCSRMMRRDSCASAPSTETNEIAALRTEIAELHARLDQPAPDPTRAG